MLKKIVWSDYPCEMAAGKPINSGYIKAYCKDRKIQTYAHILACEKAHGPRPSSGYRANHKCHCRTCINPHHLEWVTHSEDMAYRKKIETRTRYSNDVVREAVRRVKDGERVLSVATAMSLPMQSVSDWCRGKTRGKITGIVYNPRQYVVHI